MLSHTQPEHVTVACTVDIPSPDVDAGAELKLRVKVSCSPPCDLEGETIEIKDQDGSIVASALLDPYDDEAEANATSELQLRVPNAPGEYVWTAELPAYEDEEVAYDGARSPIGFAVKAHTTRMLVWDVPSAVVAGETFRMKIGIKCSSGCRQAHRAFRIVDEAEQLVSVSEVGNDQWPKSEALYFTELELRAPTTAGLLNWQAQCDQADMPIEGTDDVLPHGPASAAFHVRSVSAPDVKVRIEAWDEERQAPLPGARVVLHPYIAVTDENGVAEFKVARGNYRLFVSRSKYTTFGTPVEIAADLSTKVVLTFEPPPNRE